MTVELTDAERKRGAAYQAKLYQLSRNNTYYRREDMVKIVHKLDAEGISRRKIAKMLNRTPRSIELAMKKYGHKLENMPKAKVEERYQKMLEWDVDAFAEFFTTFSPESYFPPHVRPWIEAFLRERNLLLNVPPGHAKSIFFSTWIPIWLICRDRNVQVLLISKTKEFAKAWALDIAGNLEHNDELIKAYGKFKSDDGKWSPTGGTFNVSGRTRTVKGAQFTVESRGMNGQVLGRRADFIIVDDPTDQEEAESETERRNALRHLREQVFTRAEPQGDIPGGRITVIGQRVHMLDMYGELEKQEYEIGPNKGKRLWHNEKYPAILDWDNKQVLWPEKFTWDELQLIYARVGGHIPFSCLYQQEPLPEGAALITQEWFDQCKDRERVARQGHRGERFSKQFLPVVRVVSVDPSPTKFNAIVVGDLLYDREQFTFAVTEIYRMKARIRELSAQVDEILARTEPDYFIFEESGFLSWFRDDPWFQGLSSRVNLLLHHTTAKKNSMEYGVQSLAGDFEFRRISLPYGDEEGRRMTDMLGNEALTWPAGDTDDILMALWFVKFNWQRLMPTYHLATRVKGASGGGWSFVEKAKTQAESEEAMFRRWQRERARAKEMSGVG